MHQNYISTHDLTRRSTSIGVIDGFGWEFQLTTSQGGRLYFQTLYHFHSQFQLTTSQGGRQHCLLLAQCVYLLFQLTTSQGGRQPPLFFILKPSLFQLTTSQGGRRLYPKKVTDL